MNFNLINAEEKRKLRKCKVFLNGKESGMIVDVTENAVFFWLVSKRHCMIEIPLPKMRQF